MKYFVVGLCFVAVCILIPFDAMALSPMPYSKCTVEGEIISVDFEEETTPSGVWGISSPARYRVVLIPSDIDLIEGDTCDQHFETNEESTVYITKVSVINPSDLKAGKTIRGVVMSGFGYYFDNYTISPSDLSEDAQSQIHSLLVQIVSLRAQIKQLENQTQTFTRDLTVGSTGQDVINLQNRLINAGHLIMPAGISKGYFGQLTRQALMKYQTWLGLTATGVLDYNTRVRLNPVN